MKIWKSIIITVFLSLFFTSSYAATETNTTTNDFVSTIDGSLNSSKLGKLTCTTSKLFNEKYRYDLDDYDYKYACHIQEKMSVNVFAVFEIIYWISAFCALLFIIMRIKEKVEDERKLKAGEINQVSNKLSLINVAVTFSVLFLFVFPTQVTLEGKTFTYALVVDIAKGFTQDVVEASDNFANDSDQFFYDKAINRDSYFYRQELSKTLIWDLAKEMSKTTGDDQVELKTTLTDNKILTTFNYRKKNFLIEYTRNQDASVAAEKLGYSYTEKVDEQVQKEITKLIKSSFEIAKYVNKNFSKGDSKLAYTNEDGIQYFEDIEYKNWFSNQNDFLKIAPLCSYEFNLTEINYRSLNQFLTFKSSCISYDAYQTTFSDRDFLVDNTRYSEVEADEITSSTETLCEESVYECADALVYSVLVSKDLNNIGVLNKIANPFKDELKAKSISTSKDVNSMTYSSDWSDNAKTLDEETTGEVLNVDVVYNPYVMSLLSNVNDTAYDMYDSTLAFIGEASDIDNLLNQFAKSMLQPSITLYNCFEYPNMKGLDADGNKYVNGMGTNCFSEFSNATAMNYMVAKTAKGMASIGGKATKQVVVQSKNAAFKYAPVNLQTIVKATAIGVGLTTDTTDVIGMTDNTFGDPLLMSVALSTFAQFDAGVYILDGFAKINFTFSILAFLIDHIIPIAFFVALVYMLTRIFLILLVMPLIIRRYSDNYEDVVNTISWILLSVSALYFMQYHYELLPIIRDKIFFFSYNLFEVPPIADVEFSFGSIVKYVGKVIVALFIQLSLIAATLRIYLTAESDMADLVVYQQKNSLDTNFNETSVISKGQSGKIHGGSPV
ncbi:hypothetical protein [Vibrio furnissii]|uniref:hypothetical protein n=1 Tax=Vibrio furnissii TaxID=29494 RepID=UPI001EEA6355|nr:hypothetical protein [Vibrio furnissii]MCG6268625.1 hypothetical protein [Vibrio furnissii]